VSIEAQLNKIEQRLFRLQNKVIRHNDAIRKACNETECAFLPYQKIHDKALCDKCPKIGIIGI